MITNARALEATYVPQDLEHRDGQINQLAAAPDEPVPSLRTRSSYTADIGTDGTCEARLSTGKLRTHAHTHTPVAVAANGLTTMRSSSIRSIRRAVDPLSPATSDPRIRRAASKAKYPERGRTIARYGDRR